MGGEGRRRGRFPVSDDRVPSPAAPRQEKAAPPLPGRGLGRGLPPRRRAAPAPRGTHLSAPPSLPPAPRSLPAAGASASTAPSSALMAGGGGRWEGPGGGMFTRRLSREPGAAEPGRDWPLPPPASGVARPGPPAGATGGCEPSVPRVGHLGCASFFLLHNSRTFPGVERPRRRLFAERSRCPGSPRAEGAAFPFSLSSQLRPPLSRGSGGGGSPKGLYLWRDLSVRRALLNLLSAYRSAQMRKQKTAGLTGNSKFAGLLLFYLSVRPPK